MQLRHIIDELRPSDRRLGYRSRRSQLSLVPSQQCTSCANLGAGYHTLRFDQDGGKHNLLRFRNYKWTIIVQFTIVIG